jgi:hypothetical protein
MQSKDVKALYAEADCLDRTGMLPAEAQLRLLAEEVFGQSTVVAMTTIGYEVYRMLAGALMDCACTEEGALSRAAGTCVDSKGMRYAQRMAQTDYDAGYCAGIVAFAYREGSQHLVGRGENCMRLFDALTHFADLWNYAPHNGTHTSEAQETLHE